MEENLGSRPITTVLEQGERTLAKKSKPISPFEGRWRITSMEMWGQDFVDAEVEGYVEFGPNGLGSFQFGYISGEIDYRDGTREGKPSVEWSWDGNDEMDPAQGVLTLDQLAKKPLAPPLTLKRCTRWAPRGGRRV